MRKSNTSTKSRPLAGVELVEYVCSCGQGVYRVNTTLPRIKEHNQIPHQCNACQKVSYFTVPYPVLKVRGKIFVHWDTIRGEPICHFLMTLIR